jgi:hypothetical protein
MPANLQEEIFKRAQENSHFAKVLGFGLGHVFSYLDNELQNKIVQKSNENNPLATGLSIELGDVYYYLSNNNNEDLHNRRFREIDITKVLAKSIGTRLSNNFSCLKEHNLLQKV